MYSEGKTYQQNFFFEGEGTTERFFFNPLTKQRPENKWNIKCVSIAFYSSSQDDHTPICLWMANCPLLTGFGNSTRGTESRNDILLGMLHSQENPAKGAGAITASDTSVIDTSFRVNEINRDPFELKWTNMNDPFNLDSVETGFLTVSFQITELVMS